MQGADSLEKALMLGKIKGKRRRGRQNEIVGWHHWPRGHESGHTPGDSEGQGSLPCFSTWGHDLATEQQQCGEVSCNSVQFSRSVVSDSLRPHGLQHASLPCPSPNPRAYTNSSPLCQRCHPTISSSAAPISSCLLSFPASGSFPMSWFFALSGQTMESSVSVLPMNNQGWCPLRWTGLISLQSKGLSRVFPNTTIQRHQFFGTQPSLWSNSHIHTWLLEKPQLWLYGRLLAK